MSGGEDSQAMADRARRIDPVSLEEFQAMDFGRRKAELIDGLVTVAQAFSSSRHADITVGVVVAFANAIRSQRLPCRVQTGAGLPIRLDRDFYLGPDVMVHCGGSPDRTGLPTLVVEVLSPSNGATELMNKLHAYRSVDSIADILLLEQDAYLVDHFTRTDSGLWTGPTHLSGADAVLSLPRLGRGPGEGWRLAELYGDE